MSDRPLERLDDRELLERHVAGDPEAFGELFRRHRDRMWAVAVRVCGDPELAADAVQDGFVAAFRRAGSYRGDAAVTTWLHRVVVNACLDLLRRARPTVELTDQQLERTPAGGDPQAAVDARLVVHEALAGLPEPQRLALVLVDLHGLQVAEAAAVLEVAEGTVKSRCARGRRELAARLGPSLGRPAAGTSTTPPASDHGEGPHPDPGTDDVTKGWG